MRALFRSQVTISMRNSSVFFFLAATIDDTHSVGSVTSVIIPSAYILLGIALPYRSCRVECFAGVL